MLSSLGLEVMNSTNPELNWKIVTKGRRSKKSVARSLNGGVKVGKSISPKRVGDFSGSDYDKFGELVIGQSASGKSESVPPKKRRHLLQSPPPHPWASPLCGQDSVSQRTDSSSPFSEDQEHLQYPSCSLGRRSSNWNKRRIQGSAKVGDVSLYDQIESEYNDTGDFSGIELLAAAASMDADADKANQKDHQEDSSMPNNSDSSSSATLSNVGLKNNESENSSSNMNVHGGNMDCSQEKKSASASKSHILSPEDEAEPKVSRQHWDLNTLMDAWEEPHDDSVAGGVINDVNDKHMEGRQKVSRESDPRGTQDEFSNLKLAGKKTTSLSQEIISSEPLNVMGLGATETPAQAGEKGPDNNSIQVLNSDADIKNLNQETSPDAILESSHVTKLCLSSGMLLSENTNSIPHTVAVVHDEDFSSNVRECERTVSETVICVKRKDTKELPGMFTCDAQPAPIADLNKNNDPVALDAKHEGSGHPNKELKRATMDDTVRSCSAGAQCDGSTGFQEGYDSPYEDGELRGSFLCSWEDNDIENEYVDYESDGRNGDDDYPASEIVEGGGSEISQGTRRSLSMKISPGGKSQQLKQSVRKHFVKDNSDNNEVAVGKASNAGSGTTVEQCMETVMEEDDGTKIRQLIDRRDAVDVKVTNIIEYASKMTSRGGKLQSRIEGLSDGKEGFFMQEFRPRRLGGSYSRGERDGSPERYMNRYRSNPNGERDGVNQWRRRYTTSNYQGGEGRNHHTRPRNKIGESADKIDGQTGNYMSRGLHRPFMRRSPPVERDEYFVGRRIPPPLTRGVVNYRSRGGHYSQRGDGGGGGGRDFVEDFEPIPEDAGPSVRMPRYFSRRERSFSPQVTNLPRRRSRSRSREWHPKREFRRRSSRSPEFRPEGRMERMRLPFTKPSFASEYVEDYMSPPPRGRFSPQQNCRWSDDRNFGENHLRRRRTPPPPPPPPVRMFRRTQRFDGVGSSGRVKSDEYFRPTARAGRFSFTKLESNYEDRRREEGGEIMHRANDGGGNLRRFRHNAAAAGADNFETNNKKLNNEDDARVTEDVAG